MIWKQYVGGYFYNICIERCDTDHTVHTACSRNCQMRWKQFIHIQLWLLKHVKLTTHNMFEKLLWKQFVGGSPLLSCYICIERCETEPTWGESKLWVNPFIQLGLCILRRCETNRITEKRLRNFPVLEPKSSVIFSQLLLLALYFVTAPLKICDGVGSSPVSLAGPPKTRAMVKMVRATQDQWSFIVPICHRWSIFPGCLLTKKSTVSFGSQTEILPLLFRGSLPASVWMCSGQNGAVSHS